jgi:hypothetical protein
MKHIQFLLFLIAFQFNMNAQVKLDDFGRVVLNCRTSSLRRLQS